MSKSQSLLSWMSCQGPYATAAKRRGSVRSQSLLSWMSCQGPAPRSPGKHCRNPRPCERPSNYAPPQGLSSRRASLSSRRNHGRRRHSARCERVGRWRRNDAARSDSLTRLSQSPPPTRGGHLGVGSSRHPPAGVNRCPSNAAAPPRGGVGAPLDPGGEPNCGGYQPPSRPGRPPPGGVGLAFECRVGPPAGPSGVVRTARHPPEAGSRRRSCHIRPQAGSARAGLRPSRGPRRAQDGDP